jgi:hypothetical protein
VGHRPKIGPVRTFSKTDFVLSLVRLAVLSLCAQSVWVSGDRASLNHRHGSIVCGRHGYYSCMAVRNCCLASRCAKLLHSESTICACVAPPADSHSDVLANQVPHEGSLCCGPKPRRLGMADVRGRRDPASDVRSRSAQSVQAGEWTHCIHVRQGCASKPPQLVPAALEYVGGWFCGLNR